VRHRRRAVVERASPALLRPVARGRQGTLLGRARAEEPHQGVEAVGRRQHPAGQVFADDPVRPAGGGGDLAVRQLGTAAAARVPAPQLAQHRAELVHGAHFAGPQLVVARAGPCVYQSIDGSRVARPRPHRPVTARTSAITGRATPVNQPVVQGNPLRVKPLGGVKGTADPENPTVS
jgi:hypothetical protein